MDQKKANKILIDGFCRSVLLDWLNQSSYADNKNLRDYILYEAPYKKIVLLASTGKPLKEDASSDIQLSKVEDNLQNLFSIGAALISARPVNQYVDSLVQRGFKVTQQKVPVKGLFSRKPITNAAGEVITAVKSFANAGGKLATPLVRTLEPTLPLITFMGVMTGAGLLSRVLFAIARKLISKCHKVCKQSIPPNTKNYNVHLQICISKCKIQDLNKVITNLRSEVEKCTTVSANPEKCQVNIVKQIAKFNKHLQDENIKLQNSLTTLNKLGNQ